MDLIAASAAGLMALNVAVGFAPSIISFVFYLIRTMVGEFAPPLLLMSFSATDYCSSLCELPSIVREAMTA